MEQITIRGIPCYHIDDYCKAVGRKVTSTRILIDRGNMNRKLKAIRVRSSIYIPVVEVRGFPYTTRSGEIKHSDGEGKLFTCGTCSYTPGICDEAKAANDLMFDGKVWNEGLKETDPAYVIDE